MGELRLRSQRVYYRVMAKGGCTEEEERMLEIGGRYQAKWLLVVRIARDMGLGGVVGVVRRIGR